MRRKENIMKLWQTSSAHCMMWFFHCPCHPLFWHVFILYQDTLKKYEMQSLFSMTCVLLCLFWVLALIKDEYKLTRYNLCSIKSHYTRIRTLVFPTPQICIEYCQIAYPHSSQMKLSWTNFCHVCGYALNQTFLFSMPFS